MRIVDLHFFPGRNIYSHRPVMKMLLDLDKFKEYRTDCDPSFTGRLLNKLPGLLEHKCSRRRRGGFLERVREGTYLGHVVEHVFLELQSMAGVGMEYGKTYTGNGCIVEIISEYRCREAAEILAKTAVELVYALVLGKDFDLDMDLDAARKAAARYLPGPSTAAILSAAQKRAIPFQLLERGSSLYRIGTGKYQKRIIASISEGTGCIAVDIASCKGLTKKLLRQQGLPVPEGETVRSVEEAVAAAERLRFPVAVKPDCSNQGKGVFLNLNSCREVEKAFKLAAAVSMPVIVEKCLPGRHYRLLIVNGSLAAAAEKFPAQVVGDGKKSIAELIAEENKNPLRGEGHEKPLTKIPFDKITEEVLERQGLTAGAVVPAGQKVLLRESANLSTGGTACDVTEYVHHRQAELAVSAVKIIGLDIAGVDIIMEDISRPPAGQIGGIIEVNAAPGLRMHLFPAKGRKQDVGDKIIDYLFPPGKPARVPVFSVTGTNGKTTTARMLEYALRHHGLQTGMCCTDGFYVNGILIKEGDLTGPSGANAVLGHPGVEVAVLETARGGIIRRGLGYDRADVAVILNIRADHLGQDGVETAADLLHVKSLVAEAVYDTGTVVLNADDPHVHELAERVWTPIIYFSMQEDNITVRRHLGNGGRTLFLQRGMILAAQGNRVVFIGRARDFAVTYGGRARHQTENLLSALAACWAFGMSPRQAAFYLQKFASSPCDNPGRGNLYRIGDIQVLVDYGHNPDGFVKTGSFAKKLKAKRILAVVGVPGDRGDQLIMAAGQAAAQVFDYLFIKEDEDLRGRRPGEVAALLKKGAVAAGKDVFFISVFRTEREALQAALNAALPGDLVVVFYENLKVIQAEIDSYQNSAKAAVRPQKAGRPALESPAALP